MYVYSWNLKAVRYRLVTKYNVNICHPLIYIFFHGEQLFLGLKKTNKKNHTSRFADVVLQGYTDFPEWVGLLHRLFWNHRCIGRAVLV